MGDEAAEPKLREIFSIVLDLPPDVEVASVEQATQDGWDSLASLSLVAAVESELGLVFEPHHRERFTSFESVRRLVEEMT